MHRFPPTSSDTLKGLHFAVALCFYDGMLTYVEVAFLIEECIPLFLIMSSFLVKINHSALLADISSSDSVRAKLNMWSSILAVCFFIVSYVYPQTDNNTASYRYTLLQAIGSFSSFFAHKFWDRNNMWHFRCFCFVVSLLSCICFETTARNIKRILLLKVSHF